jgi:hypothetical protein
MRSLLLVLALALPSSTLGSDSIFKGSLVLVMPGSLSLRVPDGRVTNFRLPKSGKLSAETLAKELEFGDMLEVTARRIDASLNAPRDLYLFLDVKELRFVGMPSPDELSKVTSVLPWLPTDNLLKHPTALRKANTAASRDAALERIREVNLGIARNMPNFVADEIATRSTGHTGSPARKVLDTVESEIAFKGNDAVRENIRINGKKWNAKTSWLPGVTWDVAFGKVLKALFDLDCANAINQAGTLRYEFRSNPDGCFGPFTGPDSQFNPPTRGWVLIDGPSGSVMHFQKVSAEFPHDFNLAEAKDEISWNYVKIGNSSWLLPVSADYLYTFKSGDVWHVEVQFTNHRHFETSIKLQVVQ